MPDHGLASLTDNREQQSVIVVRFRPLQSSSMTDGPYTPAAIIAVVK
jgi:hypothetical protein